MTDDDLPTEQSDASESDAAADHAVVEETEVEETEVELDQHDDEATVAELDDHGGADQASEAEHEPISHRRRWLVLGGLAVASAAVIAGSVLVQQRAAAPGPPVPLDTWAPYWTLDDTLPELADRLPSMREVSPFWYRAAGVTDVGLDPNAPADAAAEFERVARATGVLVVPSIVDAMPAGGMAAILADPDTRARHVDALVELASSGDYDGLDLDYEQFAFADGRDTWATTRPNWIAFVTDLADALHADGRTLTVSVPPVYDDERTDDSGFWVYDHGAMAEVVDRIRIMAYDFSVPEAGPIAPLEWVQRSVDGTASVVADDSKLVLGIPLYGYNWLTDTIGTCPADAPGRTGVTARSLADLLDRRGATPIRNDDTGEWSFTYELVVEDDETSCTQIRQVHYVDGDGAQERIQIARDARLGGVALWALGYEDDPAWALVEASVRRWLVPAPTTLVDDVATTVPLDGSETTSAPATPAPTGETPTSTASTPMSGETPATDDPAP